MGDDDLNEIVVNIRACIVSSKGSIPIRNLARDYATIVQSEIPFRRFNYATLEEFLRNQPTLRVCGSGSQAIVEAAQSKESQHISALVSRQKSSSKKLAAYPSRRSYPPPPSYRGRGGGRGRGRGSYSSRPYAPRDYSSRDQYSRDYLDRDQPRENNEHSSRDYSSRDQYSRDYLDRDQPRENNYHSERDYPSRDQNSRDYSARDQPRDNNDHSARDYSSRDQYSRDYAERDRPRDYSGRDQTHNVPKRYSPNFHNRQDTVQPITVRVDADDNRQVSWKRNELPPRLQKLRQKSADSQQNTNIPPSSPISPVSKGFDSSLYLDQSKPASNSSSIISPLGPSQLIAAGRAKQQEEKAKLEQQHFESNSNFLLQPLSQQTTDLAADFARLSHQDSDALVPGNHRMPVNGQKQILEDPSSVPLLPAEAALPEPDEDVITNNVGILLSYCLSRGWPVPAYGVHSRKCSEAHRGIVHFATVKVNGDDGNTFKVSSVPDEHENPHVVKGYAAKKALVRIRDEESKKVKANKIISSDSKIICSRISDIVAGARYGLFFRSVEDEYIKRYNELLPGDWLQTVRSWPTLSVESTVNSTIIVPRDAAAEQAQAQAQPIKYDPTVAPPHLPIEALGDEEGIEDVYITHATSANNVWFRVIGKDYSDAYEVLLKDMDAYYNGEGAQELALSLEIGQYYAARNFDTWFRVCVIEVDDNQQTVVAWLVDHGDNETFSFGSLYRLAPQFCQLPRQAVLCTLEGLESFNDDELANEVISTTELLIGQTLIAKILYKDVEGGLVKVTLYDTSGENDVVVNEQLQDEIFAKAEPKLPAEGCAMEVAIGDVSKKGEVYISFYCSPLERILEIIESLGSEKISEHKLTSFKHISLNKMYLAKYSKDDTWYRAVVTTTPSVQHNKIPVRFVDYGNTESVTISDIADLDNLPPILSKMPAQAVKVALHNLPIDSLTNPEVARLHSLLLDEDKVVLIKTVSLKDDPPIVEIFTKEAENAALISVNSTIELQRKLYRSHEKKNSFSLLSPDAHLDQLSNNQDNFVLKCPDLSDSEFQAVLVVLAAHPGNFIFQPVKYAKDMKKLRGQMAAYYDAGAMPELSADRVVKNKLFAARYNDDLWYRVVVTDSPMGSRVPVRLCDFGDVTCVTVSSLRELAPEFHIYPFMAIKGKLAGVVPIHKDWSVEDCIRFQRLVVDQLLAAIIVKIQENNENPMDMVVTLNLVDTSSDNDQDIAEILIQENRAVREN